MQTKTPDQNATTSLNVIDGLDMNLHTIAQDALTPLYNSEYGTFFAYQIFGIPLAQLLAATTIFIFVLTLFILVFYPFLS